MSQPLRVLLVEDSTTDAKLIMQEVRRGRGPVVFERVEEPASMREALARQGWDLVLSDWSLPRFSGLGALAIMRETEVDLPFIIVSGTVGEELAVEAMRAGAHDYVLKDRLSRLAPLIEREIREHALRRAHRASEVALRTSEARFSRLLECGILGVVTGSPAGSIIEANAAFLRMVGYSGEEVAAGKVRWSDLTAPEWQEVTRRGVAELRDTGVASPYEKEYIRKDGSRVPVLVGLASLAEDRSIGFMIDLTAQKKAEDELERTERQLRQAQKMDAVGRLAGGIAHDFNNLLSVILSYSAMVAGELPAGTMRADVEEIGEAGRRAAELTRQLLLFSRQEVTETQVLDLNELLLGLKKMLPRLLGEDIQLAFTPHSSLGRVRVNPGHIEQVVMNLAVNARDAMPTGGKLTIETSNVVLSQEYAGDHLGCVPGAYVLLAVSDTGVGMDGATQARIFEPFFTTKEVGKGTGLGLSTVFGIVKQCGGNVLVYSEVGKGSTFKVYLPLVDAPVDSVRTSVVPATLRGSETILLVEDDDRVRAVAAGILRRHQYKVLEARDGVEAIAHCESTTAPVHLLLTDVVMPGMSGPALAKRIAERRPATKVLCMSGYTDDAIVRHGALDAGIPFLQKPFTPVTLATKVRGVLDGR